MSFLIPPNEDPRQRELRKNKAVMDALQSGATQQPQNVGQGIAAVGDAFAYRAMKSRQETAQADPWASMRPSTGLFGGMASGFSRLLGR